MIGYEKPMLKLFMVTHGTGENMNQKNPLNFISYHEQRKAPYIKCFILYSNFFRGKYLI